jgi:predicted TIM-barrel fold metal-dependent hydrolase
MKNEYLDSHIHILPPARTRGLVRWIKKSFPGHPSSEEITPEEILGDLRECGVGTVFNLVFPLREEETDSLNQFSRELAAFNKGVVPFGSLHIDTPRKDEAAERCITELGLAGIKLHPYAQGFEAFSPEFEPMFRKLDELKRPFIVHTGFDIFYGKTQDLDHLGDILDRYPDMPVVLVHSLFPRFELASSLMERHELLYLDMTNVIACVKYYLDDPGFWSSQPGFEDFSGSIDSFYHLLDEFSDRIMFGTDHPAGMGSPRTIYDDFAHLDFSEPIGSNMLGGTARRFLHLHCGYRHSQLQQ